MPHVRPGTYQQPTRERDFQPRLTASDLANEQHGLCRRKEDDEDECIQEEQAADADGFVSPFRRRPAIEQRTEDGTDGTTHVEAGLPRSVDHIARFVVDEGAVLFTESRISPEVAHEDRVVAFHDHRHGDHAGPEDRPGRTRHQSTISSP